MYSERPVNGALHAEYISGTVKLIVNNSNHRLFDYTLCNYDYLPVAKSIASTG